MSENNQESSPYNNRNHEEDQPLDRTDVLSMASLLGHVTGSLREIDKNIIERNEYSRALKMDPKETLKKLTGGVVEAANMSDTPANTQQVQQAVRPVTNTPPQIPIPVTSDQSDALEKLASRIDRLESKINSKRVKFKRGISYNINTVNIKGTFREFDDIIDVVSSEVLKQTKTITLKLNDSNKDTK